MFDKNVEYREVVKTLPFCKKCDHEVWSSIARPIDSFPTYQCNCGVYEWVTFFDGVLSEGFYKLKEK